MHMSVKIQFCINKFSPDVTSLLPILTKALDILHGNLFRIYDKFPKSNASYFSTTHIFTPKLYQLQIIKFTECNEWLL